MEYWERVVVPWSVGEARNLIKGVTEDSYSYDGMRKILSNVCYILAYEIDEPFDPID